MSYIIAYKKPVSPAALFYFTYHATYETNITFNKILDNVDANTFVFPENYHDVYGYMKYFIHKNDLYSLTENGIITKINSGGWTHISGEYGNRIGESSGGFEDDIANAYGIKNNQLYKIQGNNIIEIGSSISSNKFINVIGASTDSVHESSKVNYCAYALTDKNEIFVINRNKEIINISIFDESSVINSFSGFKNTDYSYTYYIHIIVDNKLYLMSENDIQLQDDSKKYLKVFGDMCSDKGDPSQFVLDENYNLYPISKNQIGTITVENDSEPVKWELVDGIKLLPYNCNAIGNKHLYVIGPRSPEDLSTLSMDLHAFLVDNTMQYDFLTSKLSGNDHNVFCLSNNKLYQIRTNMNLNDEGQFIYEKNNKEITMPEGYTKCLGVHTYGRSGVYNMGVAIFQ